MNKQAERRGQPIVALGTILGLWGLARILVWTWDAEPHVMRTGARILAPEGHHQASLQHKTLSPLTVPVIDRPVPPARIMPLPSGAVPAPYRVDAIPEQTDDKDAPSPMPHRTGPLPPAVRPSAHLSAYAPARWSADGWLLLRGDSGAASLATAGGSYGASQVGVVLRYRLDPDSRFRPALYLRGSAALGSLAEQEAALGLAARVFPTLPVTMMGELRASRSSGGVHIRPAALVVSELPVIHLPWQVQAEIYGQAGYVGGRAASAFADGQARITRRVAALGKAEFRLGTGLWGGVQQ
ncbi:MAG: hypothetical protein RLZZ136_445, partial [Pseudomonadota bacterium]